MHQQGQFFVRKFTTFLWCCFRDIWQAFSAVFSFSSFVVGSICHCVFLAFNVCVYIYIYLLFYSALVQFKFFVTWRPFFHFHRSQSCWFLPIKHDYIVSTVAFDTLNPLTDIFYIDTAIDLKCFHIIVNFDLHAMFVSNILSINHCFIRNADIRVVSDERLNVVTQWTDTNRLLTGDFIYYQI